MPRPLESTLSSKGQCTLPVEVRRDLGIEPGQSIQYLKNEHGEWLIQVKSLSIRDLGGAYHHQARSRAASLDEMDEAIEQGFAEGEDEAC